MGPLAGYTIIEMAGIGPGPFCAMLLGDMGANIIRIDRASGQTRSIDVDVRFDFTARGRKSIALDLKNARAIEVVLRLCRSADGLIEGFRPGVMERLGLGPGPCLEANPGLVYGRMTGWGQNGPMAQKAGHDINYLAITGLLHMLGRVDERPSPPLNLVADMGGGGMLLAYGMTCALLERHRSSKGQVVDAAMFEGALSLGATVFGQMAMGWWQNQRGANLLDSGAHFYEVYTTADDGYMAVGAIEPQFYDLFIKGLGLDPQVLPKQLDRTTWPAMKDRVAAVFKTKTRAEWTAIFDVLDACVTPVLTPDEASGDPHVVARGSYRHEQGRIFPAAAPRFSRSDTGTQSAPPLIGQHSAELLGSAGFSDADIAALLACGAVRQQG
jgi:alpha-methylacyl-CoA racemase